ncbi:nucleotidyl transferase AbiEii/AbiGii toxin family protein [bacterium]|nr:nucleotidyl transferase AbiEii/AbiGii toxin family protein [bacterium]
MKADLRGLDKGQLGLWPDLAQTPPEFVLYGGVALTLRFNHRHSADFDFFCWQEFDPQQLLARIPYLEEAHVLQMSTNTLTCLVHRENPVKLSFFGLPKLGQADEPETEEQTGLRVASLLDVAATKASVIQKRAAARDYLDMDILLTRGKLRLPAILSAAGQVYGRAFNPQISLKALTFFQDGDLPALSTELKARLRDAVVKADQEMLE